jgi:Condensation domain
MSSNDIGKKLEKLSAEKKALLQQRLQRAKAAAAEHLIQRRTPADPRVLSFGQQQLWLVDQLTPGSSAYNVPYPVRIRGALNVEALRRSIDVVVGRHEVLRTLFVNLKGQPFPAVAKHWSLEFREVDLRDVPLAQRSHELERMLKEDAARPFDLARDLKLRASLYRLDVEDYVLLHVSHHICWDLRSKGIFYEELGPLYAAFSSGKTCELPELPIQYADFALWQRRYLQGDLLQKLENYWKQQLSGAASKLELPGDHPRPPVQGMRGAKYSMSLTGETLECAVQVGRKLGATLYMVLLAAFKAFLFSYTRQEDISVGSPFAGRRKETDAIIGMFINTLVLRTRISADLTFAELVRRVRDTTLGAIAHQDLPFEKIVEAVRPPRDLSRNTLFQVNFRLQNSAPATLELPGIVTQSMETVDNASAKFDLALELPSSPKACGYFEYNIELFDSSTISRMAEDFYGLLAVLLANPDVKLTHVPIVRKPGRACEMC